MQLRTMLTSRTCRAHPQFAVCATLVCLSDSSAAEPADDASSSLQTSGLMIRPTTRKTPADMQHITLLQQLPAYLNSAKLATMNPIDSHVTSLTHVTASAKFMNRPDS